MQGSIIPPPSNGKSEVVGEWTRYHSDTLVAWVTRVATRVATEETTKDHESVQAGA